jgi:hypothetical protein
MTALTSGLVVRSTSSSRRVCLVAGASLGTGNHVGDVHR